MVLELPTTLMDLSAMNNEMAAMMLDLYASMAQSKIAKKEKRQREGIAAKKACGEWDDYGRPRILSQEMFREEYQRVLSAEIKPSELMKKLKLTKSTYYRCCKEVS